MYYQKSKKENSELFFKFVITCCLVMLVLVGCSRMDNAEIAYEDLNEIDKNNDEKDSDINDRRELKIGMSGEDVLYLHEKLHEIMQLPETESLTMIDEFGEKSQYYVTLFQATQDIEPDGVVGNETWIALENPKDISQEDIAQIQELISIDDGDTNSIEANDNVSSQDENTDNKAKKIAYLTFDDGPHPTYTPQIMSLLKKYNAEATFFALGQEVDKYPSITLDMSSDNNVVANHTYTHLDISKASDSVIKNEIIKANAAVEKATNKTPICFRPPYGAINPDTKQKIGSAGGKTIMWDVDTQDWSKPGIDTIVEHVLTYTQDGEIILMHDGGGDRTQTVAALEKILKKMTKDGWEFKSLHCAQ